MNKRIKKEIETSCEYSFPDYMGDIKKILSCRAKCRDIGKLTADGALEVNGIVEYEVLYADSENKLTAINTSSDYTVSAPINEETFRDSHITNRVSAFSLRVTGPRKLSMRASVENEITMTHSASMPVLGGALDGENQAESCTRVIKIEDYIYGEVLEREYAEEAERLPGMAGEEVEIVTSGGEVRITEASMTESGAELRGEVMLYAIVKVPNEPPFRIAKVIPISENVKVSGAEREMAVIPRAEVTGVSFGLSDDSDDKVIVANAVVELTAAAATNEELEVVTDAYLIEKETQAEYSDFEYETLAEIKREELVITERVPIGNISSENIRGVVLALGDISEAGAKLSGKGAVIGGKIALTLIACEINDDGSVAYIPIKHSFEFEENVNIGSQISGNSYIRCTMTVLSAEALIDGDEIEVRCIADATLSCGTVAVINKLDSLEVIGDVDATSSASVSVYYPSFGDTLFSVAKKYHKALSAVAEVNSLTDAASVSDVKSSPVTAKKLFII